MKSSGSIWFAYGVAVVVTLTVGLLSFTVFVLAKVFSPGSGDTSAQPPAAATSETTSVTPTTSTSDAAAAPDNSMPPASSSMTTTPLTSSNSTPAPDLSQSSTPGSRVFRSTPAEVLAVRAVASNPRQLVITVSTPTGCAQKLRANPYAEGPGAIAVRVTQQTYRQGCPWREKAILTTSSTPIANRTLIVNGIPWTNTKTGEYELALRTSS